MSPLDKKTKPSISKASRKLIESPEMSATKNKGTDDITQMLLSIQKDVSSLPQIEKRVQEVQSTLNEFHASLEYTQPQLGDACEEIVQLKARWDDYDMLRTESQVTE